MSHPARSGPHSCAVCARKQRYDDASPSSRPLAAIVPREPAFPSRETADDARAFLAHANRRLLAIDLAAQHALGFRLQPRPHADRRTLRFRLRLRFAAMAGQGRLRRYRENFLDPFISTVAIGALTTRIITISTVHILYGHWHPLHLARFAATADHISQGRFGLNIVTGYDQREPLMFGMTRIQHDERYERADEFSSIMEDLWAGEENLTYNGRFYQLEGAYVSPRPAYGRPILVSASASPAGFEYAAEHRFERHTRRRDERRRSSSFRSSSARRRAPKRSPIAKRSSVIPTAIRSAPITPVIRPAMRTAGSSTMRRIVSSVATCRLPAARKTLRTPSSVSKLRASTASRSASMITAPISTSSPNTSSRCWSSAACAFSRAAPRGLRRGRRRNALSARLGSAPRRAVRPGVRRRADRCSSCRTGCRRLCRSTDRCSSAAR